MNSQQWPACVWWRDFGSHPASASLRREGAYYNALCWTRSRGAGLARPLFLLAHPVNPSAVYKRPPPRSPAPVWASRSAHFAPSSPVRFDARSPPRVPLADYRPPFNNSQNLRTRRTRASGYAEFQLVLLLNKQIIKSQLKALALPVTQ